MYFFAFDLEKKKSTIIVSDQIKKIYGDGELNFRKKRQN